MKNYYILFSILFSVFSFAQKSDIKLAYIKIVDVDTNQPINHVQIFNLNSKISAYTTKNGLAAIYISPFDSLKLTAAAYQPHYMFWNTSNKDTTIILEKNSIILDEIIVSVKKEFNTKQENIEFLENTFTPEEMRKMTLKRAIKIGLGFSINVDELYELLSKEGKIKRKLVGYKIEDAKRDLVEWNIIELLSSELLNLNIKDPYDFIGFCSFDSDFMLNLKNEYDFVSEIKNCYSQYKDF